MIKKPLYKITFLTVSLSSAALGEDVSFFKGNIDYWAKENEPEVPITAAAEVSKPSSVENAPQPTIKRNFDWNKVMDPKNDEFFKEGDYTPPAPFMEVARNPSDENIRMWQAYIEKKNMLAQRLQMRLQEFGGGGPKHPSLVLSKQVPTAKSKSVSDLSFDPKRYQFRLYFDSQCPHCQRMMHTMKELALKGAAVEAKQIGEGSFNSGGLPFVFSKATGEEVKRHGITSVPFLLVGDLNKKVVYKLNGYKTVSSIFEEINASNKN